MRYQVLACDYDGTVARDGLMDSTTAAALGGLRTRGRRIVLVTGRRLDELLTVCPDLGLFDVVVAENGAILCTPSSREVVALAAPPPPGFVEALRDRGVTDLAVGAVMIATWHPHTQAVLDTIQDRGLELQVVFNKGAVMVLPSGVNKATGLAAALARLGLSPQEAVAIGDAENDQALLAACACGVAVANALPALRERADLVTAADHGAGVAELCERLRATDLAELGPALARHDPPRSVGRSIPAPRFCLPAYGSALLIAGTSGGGKSTALTGIGEHVADRGYQHVNIDPEGDLRGRTIARSSSATANARATGRRGEGGAGEARRERRREPRRAHARAAARRSSARCCPALRELRARATAARTGSSSRRRTT